MKAQVLLLVLVFGFQFVCKGIEYTKTDYVQLWYPTAQEQMIKHGVPASITLAQGILESGSGNSNLARIANNHFGIKCHGWQGETFYQDDDEENECFRAYENASASYNDHSLFLTGRSRYAFLFEIDKKDYQSWAHGLKKAGYATNPKYAYLLISIIEELGLSQYDEIIEMKDIENHDAETLPPALIAITRPHEVLVNNKVKYVLAHSGDTYFDIATEFELGLWQLYKYNDTQNGEKEVEKNDMVFIQRKRNRGKTDVHIVEKTCTLIDISDIEAVKLKSLLKKNPNVQAEDLLFPGQKVILK